MKNVSLKINGKNEILDTEMSIKTLLEKKGINPNVVACELNLKIIKRKDLDRVSLKEGDNLEVIQMIGGG